MEKVLPRLHKRYENLQLFAQDIREMVNAMSHGGRKVEIRIDDWKLSDIHELEDCAKEQPVARELTLLSFGLENGKHHWTFDLHVNVENGTATVLADKATVEILGIDSQLGGIFSRCVVIGDYPGLSVFRPKPWDTVILKPRETKIRIAGADAGVPEIISPEILYKSGQTEISTSAKSEPVKSLELQNYTPTPIAQTVFNGPSVHHHGPTAQNIAGHNQMIATDHGRNSVGGTEKGPGWFTKALVIKTISIVGAVIVALAIWYAEGKGVKATSQP